MLYIALVSMTRTRRLGSQGNLNGRAEREIPTADIRPLYPRVQKTKNENENRMRRRSSQPAHSFPRECIAPGRHAQGKEELPSAVMAEVATMATKGEAS